MIEVGVFFGLLYEVPGGNLVDGLPPAASTGAGSQPPPSRPRQIYGMAVFGELVLEIPL